jgi:hypothetical protein
MDYAQMSGPQLVAAYNAEMIRTGGRQIKEIRTRQDGIERLRKLNGGAMTNGTTDVPADPEAAKRQFAEEMGDPSAHGKPPQGAETQASAEGGEKPAATRRRKEREPVRVDVSDKRSIEAGFALREGTHKAKAARRLIASLGRMVAADQLVQSTYGEEGGTVGSLQMVLKGVQAAIDGRGLPLELKKERGEDKKLSFGLFAR